MSEANGQTPQADVQETDAPTTDQPKTFGEDYVKDLRQEAAGYRVKAKEYEEKLTKIEAERVEAETQRLEKQGEFQALYETANESLTLTQTKVSEYESQLTAQNEVLEKLYNSQAENVPEHIKALLADRPVSARLDWLAENQDKLNTKSGGTPLRNTKRGLPDVKPKGKLPPTIRF